MAITIHRLNEFKSRVKALHLWKSYEVKACLIRAKPTDVWKLGFINIQLLDNTNIVQELIYDHELLRLIRETRNLNSLNKIMTQLMTAKEELVVGGERASLELMEESLLVDFKDRRSMARTFYVDSPCYLLTRSGRGGTRELEQIERVLRQRLPRHDNPQESMRTACRSLLGVNFGGAYHPHIWIFAPIFIKVESIRIENNKIVVRLYRSKNIKRNRIHVTLFGKDDRGEATFSERLNQFHSTKIKDIIESFASIENRVDTTVYLNIELYYGDIDYSLEDFSRPFKSQPPLSGNIKEINKKKKNLRQIYNRAKIENNSNVKGALLECFTSQLISLVPNLEVIRRNHNSGIEEVDIEVLNNNGRGIWEEFEPKFFVECKNWKRKVDAPEIRNFEGKLRNYFLHSGIFVAIKGYTGNKREGAVGQSMLRFKQEGLKVLLMDGKDIEDILHSQDLSVRLNEKWFNLH
jgi:Restriction endonuclease